MKVKYTAIQNSFLNKVRDSQKRLQSSLQDCHYAAIMNATVSHKRALTTIKSALVEIETAK